MRNKLIVGAGVKCLINGVDIGTIFSISWQFTTARDEERGLDSMLPFELAPTNTSISLSLGIYRVRDDGGMAEYGIEVEPMHIDEDSYFTLELRDRLTGSTYLKVTHAAVDSQGWSLAAKGILTGQLSCHGLTAKSSYR